MCSLFPFEIIYFGNEKGKSKIWGLIHSSKERGEVHLNEENHPMTVWGVTDLTALHFISTPREFDILLDPYITP